jgi:hypothetical protein
MNVINGGGTLTTKSIAVFQSVNITDGAQLGHNADAEMIFQGDGKYSITANGDNFPIASIHTYDLNYVGEYGMFVSAEKEAVPLSSETIYTTVIAGIRTDNADLPTAGKATYSANEDSYYENYIPTTEGETPQPSQYNNFVGVTYGAPSGADYDSLEEGNSDNGFETNGNFTMTLEADFTRSTVKGSAEGVVSDSCCDSSVNTHLPLAVTFDESSIAQSSFSGTGTASVDNQDIPINYGGNFFGPEAAEVGLILEGKNDNNATVSGLGYLTK